MLSPAVLAANGYFWFSPDWQTDFLFVWRVLAAHFRDEPGVVGYDLLNEPNAAPLPPLMFEARWLWPLYARGIQSIAAVDPNHIFFIEGPLHSEALPGLSRVMPLAAPNEEFLRHLARPYVAAAGAGVRGGRGDGIRGHLRVRVSAAHDDVPIVIAWPAFTLGPPSVEGTCIRSVEASELGARVQLELAPGAACDIRIVAASSP